VNSNVLVSASPRSLAGEVGGVRGTVNNFGSAIGTAVSGVVLIAALTSVFSAAAAADATLSPAMRERLTAGQMTFVTNTRLEKEVADAGVTSGEIAEIARLNDAARLAALRSAFLALVAIAALGFIVAGWLPARLPGQDGSPPITAA
jgi:hypothetical protein